MFAKPLMRGVCAVLFTAYAVAPEIAEAAYPERAIRLVVAYPPGGTTDHLARRLAKGLSANLGQLIVVENKPGAGGNVGAATVVKAAPDGYTLGIGSAGNLALNYASYSSVPYDSRTDITPISVLAVVPNVILVAGKSSIKSLEDLILHARSVKGTFFGSTGAGNGPHLTGELFKARIGADSTHVPYQGAALEIAALLKGEVDYGFDNLTSALPFIQSGQLTALAVTGANRSASLPDVPTAQEQGLENFEVTAWFALFGPARLDPAAVAKLEAAIASLKADRVFWDSLKSIGTEPQLSNGRTLGKLIEMERERWPRLLQEGKVQINE